MFDVLPFIGTAAQHLASTEAAIARARAAHAPTRALLKRRKLLIARCAALGGN